MPCLVTTLTPKDLVLDVCNGGRAERAGDTPKTDWRADLGNLCAHYRGAIVEWFVHRGLARPDAEDLDGDFIQRWLVGNPLARYTPGPSPFRAFLSRCLSNFLREHVARQKALRRGGAAEHVADAIDDQPAPEPVWMPADEVALAMAVYARAMERLSDGKVATPAETLLLGAALDLRPGAAAPSYAAIASQTGLTVSNVKVRVFRIREAFREAFHHECTRLGGSGNMAKAEMTSLFKLLLGVLQQRV